MRTAAATLVAVVSAQTAWAHPTFYPHAPADVNCNASPPVLSYHAHVVFSLTSDVQVQAAIALRESARAFFSPYLGEDCDGRYDNGRLCMIMDHPINETLAGGPFPSGEWSIFTPVSYYAEVLTWFTQHYTDTWPGFSLLMHTNTGCEYEDHSTWALWAGTPWVLNLEIFTKGQQTDEFGHYRNDAGNPTCAHGGAVCGTRAEGGQTVPCCVGGNSTGVCACYDLPCKQYGYFTCMLPA